MTSSGDYMYVQLRQNRDYGNHPYEVVICNEIIQIEAKHVYTHASVVQILSQMCLEKC